MTECTRVHARTSIRHPANRDCLQPCLRRSSAGKRGVLRASSFFSKTRRKWPRAVKAGAFFPHFPQRWALHSRTLLRPIPVVGESKRDSLYVTISFGCRRASPRVLLMSTTRDYRDVSGIPEFPAWFPVENRGRRKEEDSFGCSLRSSRVESSDLIRLISSATFNGACPL